MIRCGFLVMTLLLSACAKMAPVCDLDEVWDLATTQRMVPVPFSAHTSPGCPDCPGWIEFYDRHGISHLAFIGEYDTPYKDKYPTFVLLVRRTRDGRYERVTRLDTCRERIDYLSFRPGEPDLVVVFFTAGSDDVGGISLTSPPCFRTYYTEDGSEQTPLCWSRGPDGEYDWFPAKH